MQEALSREQWDVIISDYSMPGFTGIKALEILKATGLDIPFIIVSGKIDEETAVEAMKKGAVDYISKNNLARLIPAVEREIKDCEIRKKQKKMHSELIESEERFRLAFNNANIGMCLVDLKGNFTKVNQKLCEILGYSKEELEGFNTRDFTYERDKSTGPEFIKNALEGKSSNIVFEKRYINKNGDTVWAEVSSSIVKDEKGSPLYFISQIKDITKKKNTEEALRKSEENYRLIVDNTSDLIFRIDMNGNFIFMSKSVEEHTGYTDHEIVGKNIKDFLPPRSYADATRRIKQRLDGVEKLPKYEVDVVSKDGKSITFELNTSPIYVDEKIESILIVARDVSERKESEEKIKNRLLFEETIATISKRFTKIEDLNQSINLSLNELGEISKADRVYIFKFNEDMTKIDNTHEWCRNGVSPQIEYLKGISADAFPWWMEKINNSRIILVKDVAKLPPEASSEKETLESWGVKSFLVVPIYVKTRLYGFVGFDNMFEHVSWEKEDIDIITLFSEILGSAFERNKMLHELKESEENYRTIVEGQTEFIARILPDGTHIFANDALCKYLGLKKEEIIGKKITDIKNGPDTPEEDMKKLLEHFASFNEENPIKSIENRFIFQNGEVRWAEWKDKAVFDENGNIIEFQSIGRDVTDKKMMNEEINLLYNAIEQAPTIVVITDKQGNIEYVNPKFIEITGYDLPEALGKSLRMLKTGFLPKEHFEALWKSISSGKIWKGEFYNRKKDGTTYWESASISPVKNSIGEITHFIKVSEDITYKKLAEKDIQEKEETLRGILSATPIGINLMQERSIVWCNYYMKEITGYSEQELVGRNTKLLYVNEEEYQRFGDLYREKFEGPLRFETQWITKDKRVIDVLILLNPLNSYDLSKGYITIVSDITKSKKSQKQLDENLEYFAHLVDQIRNPLAIMSGFVQVETENEKLKERLLRQIDRIEELVKQLDQGWMDTEDTRRFLKRYI
ncbi:MAG: Bacterioopsin transcriptional activator [Candidatus Methanofastidiosum methylothiophilum]|uniref:Bacterioopsin transcriptional activator n=1 Tax=Candidatus Methanofastidiosum methylothiophilum TaxID=1705564 RepID=A0A150J7Y6_9EURY|nr:MAG: Bacterioopsin transcriptional activator [Candidatus Methanofastidiosum methylthiophilus]